jgi:phage virion morphogenesis protein
MAGVHLDVQLEGEAFRAALERVRAVASLRPVFADIGEYLLRAVDARFSSETGPDGQPWAPLSERYKRRKRGAKILTENSLLRRINYSASEDDLVVGTNRIYGAIHQLGMPPTLQNVRGHTTRKGVNVPAHTRLMRMPARPYLGINPKDETELAEIVNEHLTLAWSGR